MVTSKLPSFLAFSNSTERACVVYYGGVSLSLDTLTLLNQTLDVHTSTTRSIVGGFRLGVGGLIEFVDV